MGARSGVGRLLIWGLAVGAVSGCVPPEPERSRPVERAVWIERIGEAVDHDQEHALRRIGPQYVFLKIGDLDVAGDRLTWASEPAFPISPPPSKCVLVIGGTERLVESFDRFADVSLAEQMATFVRDALDRAKRRGLSCSGVHLDILPRGLLRHYGRVLRRLRARMPGPVTLSATIPAAWERDPSVSDLVRQLDFSLVRMVSEEEPQDLTAIRASVDVREIGPCIRRFERFGIPFYIEGRAEGRCVLLDASSRVVSALGDITPWQLIRGLGFRCVESYPLGIAEARMRVPTDFSGEYVVVLAARRTSRVGGYIVQPGERIACRLPTARVLRRQIEAIEVAASPWRRGYSLWLSGIREGQDLPVTQIALLVRGGSLEPRITVKGEITGSSLLVRVENVGMQESALQPRAVEVRLRVQGARIHGVDPGDFVEVVREPSGKGASSSVHLTLYADGIRQGETLRAAVRIARRIGSVRVFASSRVRDPDDFVTLSGPEVGIAAIPQ